MKTINTLFLLSHTEKGGGEVLVYNLLKNIDRRQFRPFVGHLDFRKGEFIHEFNKIGVVPKDFGAGRLRNLPLTIAAVLRLAYFIRSNSIDVIFSSGPHNHIYAALAKILSPVKIVDHVGNYYAYPLKANPLIARLALKLRADYYMTVSFTCLRALEQLIPHKVPRRVIYPGIDKDFIYSRLDNSDQIRQRLGLHEKDRLISVIARLQRWKGQDVFLRAASLIAKACPQAHFCIVGGALFGMEENYPSELQELINSLGLARRCWMIGHQGNVRDWISASDVIVHSSKIPEPGAIIVMEAMCLGKPVVATSCGAPSELVNHGVTGLLCQPDSAEDLAEKVLSLLNNQELAVQIGEAAKQVARQRFSALRMAREVEEILKEVVAH